VRQNQETELRRPRYEAEFENLHLQFSVAVDKGLDANVRRDISILPGMLQRIDDWIAEGVLGGEELNAARLPESPPACGWR
jgi:hypothetical protein